MSRILGWRDVRKLDAAMQMALDEAVFRYTLASGMACARFYGWEETATTVGYFHRVPLPEATTVRRFTGGGLVEHGEDLTFVLTIPAGSDLARATAVDRYRWIHEKIAKSLKNAGYSVRLSEGEPPTEMGPCFVRPVPWDLLNEPTGRKIGGGAQRRSRGAVIHQGSLRLPNSLRSPKAEWITEMLGELAVAPEEMPEPMQEKLMQEAERLVRERYGREEWNLGRAGS